MSEEALLSSPFRGSGTKNFLNSYHTSAVGIATRSSNRRDPLHIGRKRGDFGQSSLLSSLPGAAAAAAVQG